MCTRSRSRRRGTSVGIVDGKRVVVTGAGQGLGRAYALALAAEGALVVVNDLDGAAARATVEAIEARGGAARADAHSVAEPEGARALVGLCVEAFGGIDALINNAGVLHRAGLLEETPAGMERTYRVNVYGTFFCAQEAAKAMLPQRRGVIVNTTSFAQAGGENLCAYNSSKGAVASLTYSWAIELAAHGIRVNALSPSGATGMTDYLNATRPGDGGKTVYQDPEAGAPIAVYLVSDHARFTGQVVRLQGNALQLHSHPGPWREAARPGGWTVQDIVRHFPETLGADLHPVGAGITEYLYHDQF